MEFLKLTPRKSFSSWASICLGSSQDWLLMSSHGVIRPWRKELCYLYLKAVFLWTYGLRTAFTRITRDACKTADSSSTSDWMIKNLWKWDLEVTQVNRTSIPDNPYAHWIRRTTSLKVTPRVIHFPWNFPSLLKMRLFLFAVVLRQQTFWMLKNLVC